MLNILILWKSRWFTCVMIIQLLLVSHKWGIIHLCICHIYWPIQAFWGYSLKVKASERKNYLHASRCLQWCSGQILAVPQLIVTCGLVREFLCPGMRADTTYLKVLLCFLLLNDLSATFASSSFQSLTKVSPLLGGSCLFHTIA